MKKNGVINQEISNVIAGMGHKQMLTVCDAGLPIPPSVQRIDLALKKGTPDLLETLDVLALELQVEKLILASEIMENGVEVKEKITAIFPNAELETVPHEEFKEKTKESTAIIRTGEFTPYANVILVSGVVF
jgi:D-ribose pyranase